MKATILAALACATLPAAHAGQASPMSKVMQLISDLQGKIIAEGKEAQNTYTEFAEFCEDRSKNLGFEVKTAKREVADLQGAIDEEVAIIESLTSKVGELSGSITSYEKDLKAAKAIRAKEAKVFAKEEKGLVEVRDALQSAARVIEEGTQKGGASMLQVKNAANIASALGEVVAASSLASADARQLSALIQAAEAAADGEGAGASDSGGILETLEDLMEKAQEQLAALRQTESANINNYEMLKASMEDELKYAEKEMAGSKQSIAASTEKKASAEGDLASTSKDLKEDLKAMADLHQACMTKASDFEEQTKSRDEELKALATAKKTLTETMGFTQESFVQLARSRLSSRRDIEAVRLIRDMARKDRSPALAQLAMRISKAQRVASRAGQDPFGKIKGLIADMISKLEEEAEQDATEKAYCDKELGETTDKHEDKTTTIKKLKTKIDQMSSRSSQLKSQVAELQKSLSELTKAQGGMDKIRQEEHADFAKAKDEMDQGLKGVKLALKVLRDYYENSDTSGGGAGAGIIGLLEVVESDLNKGLIELTATEDAAQASYDKETKENEVEAATKEQDVKYKSEEAVKLDEAVAEASSDLKGEEAELEAVTEFKASLEKRCIAKPEGFEERIKRMHQEIEGLKEALKILEGEAVLLQRSSRRALRTPKQHRSA